MEFIIGEKVKIIATNERGTVTDKLYSEAKQTNMYVIKPEDGGRSYMRKESECERLVAEKQYLVETEIAETVVIGVIYEVDGDRKTEVCRGHGHIIHEGAEGIAQACSYAYRKALEQIDSGIYFKQRRQD